MSVPGEGTIPPVLSHEAATMEVLDWVANALGAVTTLGREVEGTAAGTGAGCADVATLFPRAAPLVRRVVNFEAVALLSVDPDGLGFSVAGVDPVGARERIESEVAEILTQRNFESGFLGRSVWSVGRWMLRVTPSGAVVPSAIARPPASR